MTTWAAAGGTAVVIPVIWGSAQPEANGPVSLSSAGNNGDDVLTEILQAKAAGLSVILEFDLQYPPAWVKQQVPQFKNQGGTAYASSNPGADVRDWIWSQVGRDAVSGFVKGALNTLAPELSDIAGIRAGGGYYGELQYPDDGSTVNGQPSYWGYDAPAQAGAGLATGETTCPLPGYVYGTGTAAQDSEWASWYLQSLGNWIHWYILQLRADGWSGPVYVLHPSFGIRSNWSPTSAAYKLELSHGTDFEVQMDAYETLSNVWPWSTWADAAEPYWSAGDTIDSDMAPWRKLLILAQERGLASHIMGENTGGGGAPAIGQLMSGALAAGYTGIFYLDYPSLLSNGLLGDLTSQFAEYAG